ncbi:MAG: hypothetical protein H6574_22915 [Lewinellaceae bacterium]|nr:hypothetical protein [Lewinellaceae bacterium]
MKKRVPLNVISAIESALKDAQDLIGVYYEDGMIISLIEKNDPDSEFYFKIESIEVRDAKGTAYSISYLPAFGDNMQPYRGKVSASALSNHLNEWIAKVIQFNKDSPVFDDHILQTYYDDLGPKFIISDDDADIAPYPIQAQNQLYDLYEELKSLVEKEKHPDNSEEAEQVIKQIEVAQRSISKLPKRQAAKNLQKILARIIRYSYRIGKMIIEGTIVDLVVRSLTGG